MVFFVILTPFLCTAADTTATRPKAFLPESIYEFTPVVEGTIVAYQFILQNPGNAPLKILKLDSG